MNYSINITRWFALAPGISSQNQWLDWATQNIEEWTGELPKYQKIPMMAARRMSVPSRLAIEVGLTLLNAQPDAAIFISRHGELERTYKIIQSLAKQTDISPTDFAMSVHNTAAGLLTITAKNTLPVTSLAAGIDGFQQGMLEAQAMLNSGAKSVLIIDFDGFVPELYHNAMTSIPKNFAYAAGFIVTKGGQLNCQQQKKLSLSFTPSISRVAENPLIKNNLPQSLSFLKNWLTQKSSFTIQGTRHNWQWAQ